jgi:hypothetical protein
LDVDMQTMDPYLHYRDIPAVMDFLAAAFSYREALAPPSERGYADRDYVVDDPDCQRWHFIARVPQ